MVYFISFFSSLIIILFIITKIHKQKHLISLVLTANEVNHELQAEYTGFIISVLEPQLFNLNDNLRIIFNCLSNSDKVIIYKVPFRYTQYDTDAVLIQKLNIDSLPSVIFVKNGNNVKGDLDISRIIYSNDIIKYMKNYIQSIKGV